MRGRRLRLRRWEPSRSPSGRHFTLAERRARDPILSISFFKLRGFSIGNAAVFMSSFAIFGLFAFAPLFLQGALGKNPVEVGTAVLSISLGWSIGSLVLGRFVNRWGSRNSALAGSVFLIAGCAFGCKLLPKEKVPPAVEEP